MNTNLKPTSELNRSLVAIVTSVVFTCVIGSFQDFGSTNPTPTEVTNKVANIASASVAHTSSNKKVEFPPGSNSTAVDDTVIRGTTKTYLLKARGGQVIDIQITSPEKNAVFDIISPNGDSILKETFSWKGVLPETGDYQVVVGGTRGNATYNLAMEID